MKTKTALLIGLGVGYVLGAKAGRERYDQIHSAWTTVIGDKGKAVVDLSAARARDIVSNGLHDASQRIRDSVAE